MRPKRRPRGPRDLWIVVPVSGIARGKSRLAPVLSPAERTRLNRQLVGHAVAAATDVLAHTARCLVISNCARTRRLAQAMGATALAEGRPRRGLNAAIRRAVRFAACAGARHALVLPVDLPHVSAIALQTVLGAVRRRARRIVVPDRDDAGTNILVIPARPSIEVHFGAESFSRHLQAALAAGQPAVVLRTPALTQDIDTPPHLQAWAASGRRWD